MSLIADPSGAPAASDLIKDATSQTFMADVVEASRERPVIVDFWAPGCGPCQTLTPMLEKLTAAAGGAIALVKVNVQDAQEIAAQLRIQSVPTVYCFKNGQPVDGFQGALPESELRKFMDKQLGDEGSPLAEALAQAKEMLENGEVEAAQNIYMQVQQHDQGNPEAIAGIIRCYMALDQVDLAKEIAENLTDEMKRNDHIASAIAAMELAGGPAVDTSEMEAKLAADENDHQARFDLAMALYGAGQNEEALVQLLEIVKKDRTWNEDGARQQMLKIFEAIGLSDPLVLKMRKKLTTVLF